MTEAQEARIREIGMAARIGSLDKVGLKKEDVALLVHRLDDLMSPDHLLGAEPLMQWTLARLEEDLREKRGWLADQVEQMRIVELQVREAEHALAGVKAILAEDGMFRSGGEVIQRWDAMEALYAAQGMLPVPEAKEEPPEAPAQPEKPPAPEPVAEVAPEPEPPPAPAPAERAPWGGKTRGRPEPVDQSAQEEAVFAALKTAAGPDPQIQVSLGIIGAASGVAPGSLHAVLRRLAKANRIKIIPDKPEKGTQRPNIYRFIESAEPPKVQEAPAIEEPTPEPVPAETAAHKLAAAWGAEVKPKPKAKPTGAVSASASLRDRILGVLSKSACTTSGVASMLDIKELVVCQTLEAMKHEGAVQPDEMPEAGRRAQLWRAATEPSPA